MGILNNRHVRVHFSWDDYGSIGSHPHPNPPPRREEGVSASEAKQSHSPAFSQYWEKSCLPGGRQGVRDFCLNCPEN